MESNKYYSEDDYLQLSGIQHFEFCRRQWALIHVEGLWLENYQTIAGSLMHEKAHNETFIEKRGDLIIMRGLHVSSSFLGLSGQCDIVELHKTKNGITLFGIDGTWRVCPVEYKKGRPKEGREDEVQLCAQAICLEQMLLADIEFGYLYYGEPKKRQKVFFTQELRTYVQKNADEMHSYYKRGYTPKVKTTLKCRSCSLKDICVPKLNKNVNVEKYIMDNIEER